MTKQRALKFVQTYAILIALIVEVIFFAMTAPAFMQVENIFNILRSVSTIGIMAVGMTMIIITGGIDLSVGAICGIAGVIAAKLMVSGVHPVVACAVSTLAGALVGLVNGFFVSTIGVTPMIATLGSMTAIRGLAYLLTGGIPVYGFTKSFTVLGQGYVGVVPIPVIIMAVVFVAGYLLLNRTCFGQYIYGVGSNEEASRLSGINNSRVKYVVYTISGVLSAVTGIILLSRLNSGIPNTGDGSEMEVITAVVIGGVSMKGGEGNLPLVIIGVLIMGTLANGLVMLNVNTYLQKVIQGLVLLLAVSFDCVSQRGKAKKA